jgi:hypothetical protein
VIGKPRRTKLIPRDAGPFVRRDARIPLIFVATEDTYAAKQYLDALQERGLVDRSRVEVVALPTTDGRSALGALVERLKAHRDALDVDQQKAQSLGEAVQVARSRGYRLAGSNPCFELWLLLHLTGDVAGIPSGTEDRSAADLCAQRLRDALLGDGPGARGYNKARIEAERFAVPERVRDACARARALSPDVEPWPSAVGTHVHALVGQLPAPPAARDA